MAKNHNSEFIIYQDGVKWRDIELFEAISSCLNGWVDG